MNNTIGKYLNVTLLSYIAPPNGTNGTRNITTNISTDGNNTIEWTCVTLIVHDAKNYSSGEFYYKKSSNLSYSTNYLSLNPEVDVYDPSFLRANTMMFGISKLIMNVNYAITQQFVLNTDNVTDPQYNFKINQNQDAIRLEQFFIWKDTCSNSTPGQQVPTSGFTCGNCTPAQYNNTWNYCIPCTLDVQYCVICNKTQCLNCTPGTNRVVNATLQKCVCNTSFWEVSGICVSCSTLIPNCNICSNQTFCTNCTTNFTTFGTDGKCYCQNTSTTNYYMVNGACLNVKGCLTPSSITSGAYCVADQCDTINNFYQTNTMLCQCLNNTQYNNYTGRCDGICGDNSTLDNDCDLGAGNNHPTGTPCNDKCKVVTGFYCYSPTKYSNSICVTTQNYTGQYLYATK